MGHYFLDRQYFFNPSINFNIFPYNLKETLESFFLSTLFITGQPVEPDTEFCKQPFTRILAKYLGKKTDFCICPNTGYNTRVNIWSIPMQKDNIFSTESIVYLVVK